MGYCPSTKVYGQKLSNAGRQVRYNNRAMLTWLALFFAKRMKTKEVHAGAKALLIAHAGRRCVGCGGDSPDNIFECTVCSHQLGKAHFIDGLGPQPASLYGTGLAKPVLGGSLKSKSQRERYVARVHCLVDTDAAKTKS